MANITINGITLDPIVEGPQMEALAVSSLDTSRTQYVLIQTSGPLSAAQRNDLEGLGATLLEYVPEDTYIARYPSDNLSPITQLGYVQWASAYMKGFKIARALYDSAPESALEVAALAMEYDPVGEGKAEIDVVLHSDANVDDAADKIASTAGVDFNSLTKSSRKIRAVVGRDRLSLLADIDDVRHIEKVYPAALSNDVAIGIIRANVVQNATPSFRGSGEVVCVCDTGFDMGSTANVHSAFGGRVKKLYPLGRSKSDDPHGHGTHVAGSVLGDGIAQNHGPVTGSAPGASLVLQSVLDANGGLGGLPSDLNNLFDTPYNNDGVRVHTNSWGTTNSAGHYTSSSREVDEFSFKHRDMLIVFAAGNPGRDSNANGVIDLGSVEAPGTAKNCLTVGASESLRPDQSKVWAVGSWAQRYPADPIRSDLWADDPAGMAAFSGRGPTRDGRIKPDVVAPGTSILSAHSRRADVGDFWGTKPERKYCYMGGTSMATPLVAGTAALIREYLRTERGIANPSGSLMKALIINGATDLLGQYAPTEAGPAPNFVEGFGRVDVVNSIALDDPARLLVHDETTVLDTGEEHVLDVSVPKNRRHVKVTLVWTDPPGEGLVNDLDLAVRTATGEERHGNMPAGSTNFDRKNNVEQVYWRGVPANQLKVIVKAFRIPLQPQNYSLVVRFE